MEKSTERIAILETQNKEILKNMADLKVSVDNLGNKFDKFCEVNSGDHSKYITRDEFKASIEDINKTTKTTKVWNFVKGIATAAITTLFIWLLTDKLK